jgi:FkbM family methyltransferase
MSLHIFLANILQLGLDIQTVFDIGACKGDWSKEYKQTLNGSQFFLFEANHKWLPFLEETCFPYLCGTVLSSPGKEFVEFYDDKSTGASYYKENTGWFDGKYPVKYPCKTLDDVILQHNLPTPNLVKLDTQGSELDILSGAKTIIGKTDLFYVECPIVNYNQGAPNIYEYINFFLVNDYIPIDCFELHKLENVLIQMDILFMRRETKEKYLGNHSNIKVI